MQPVIRIQIQVVPGLMRIIVVINIDHFHIQCLTGPDLRVHIILQHTASQIIFLTGQLRYCIPGVGRCNENDAKLRVGFPQLFYNAADGAAVSIFIIGMIRIRRGFDGIVRVIVIQS